ncbi:hypothetical protein JCM10512_1020 [Bacteroides reticulotermitis JCM 10512]|uniref:Uncharacterized protein n=1 Tax=Bacteroides reticulotermitis JCM 10512 TaxID=1445607 RepID=W4UNN7_9BACE|nr:hypothetical protein JCM10512_1020 [Bacteroides reticulotermitis JCM 10512]
MEALDGSTWESGKSRDEFHLIRRYVVASFIFKSVLAYSRPTRFQMIISIL